MNSEQNAISGRSVTHKFSADCLRLINHTFKVNGRPKAPIKVSGGIIHFHFWSLLKSIRGMKKEELGWVGERKKERDRLLKIGLVWWNLNSIVSQKTDSLLSNGQFWKIGRHPPLDKRKEIRDLQFRARLIVMHVHNSLSQMRAGD